MTINIKIERDILFLVMRLIVSILVETRISKESWNFSLIFISGKIIIILKDERFYVVNINQNSSLQNSQFMHFISRK